MPRPHYGEIFPLFDWELFSKPRRIASHYSVEVLEVTDPRARAARFLGRVVTTPGGLPFLRDTRFQKTALALVRELHRRAGSPTAQGSPASDAREVEVLNGFLRPSGITRYRLVRLHYEPLSFHAGTLDPTVEVLGTFDVRPRP